MWKMILNVLSGAINAIGGWLKWKSTPVAQHQQAADIVAEEERERIKRRLEINRACHEGDEDAVNKLINGAAWLVATGAFVLSVGCTTANVQPKYVAADRRVTCVTNETGAVEYWRVPPLVMEELLNAKVELSEMKKETKIREIAK